MLSVTRLPLGDYGEIRIELSATNRHGPFRLTVDHPAKQITEYYVTLEEALRRREEFERILDPRAEPSALLGT